MGRKEDEETSVGNNRTWKGIDNFIFKGNIIVNSPQLSSWWVLVAVDVEGGLVVH